MILESKKPVTAKDVMRILECSKATAYRKLEKIKQTKHNPKQAIITLHEFLEFYEMK